MPFVKLNKFFLCLHCWVFLIMTEYWMLWNTLSTSIEWSCGFHPLYYYYVYFWILNQFFISEKRWKVFSDLMSFLSLNIAFKVLNCSMGMTYTSHVLCVILFYFLNPFMIPSLLFCLFGNILSNFHVFVNFLHFICFWYAV